MIRTLTLAIALLATPAFAGGPGFTISGARAVGIPGLPELAAATGARCRASGRTTIHVTFSDPEGIAYAAVDLGAVQVRPGVSARARTWLWLPDYARPARGYRWRYEEDGVLATRHTIPVTIDMVPGAGPIPTEVMAKDGTGAMTIRTFALMPAACRSGG